MSDKRRSKADVIREPEIRRAQRVRGQASPGQTMSDCLAEIDSIYGNSGLGLCALDHAMRFVRINPRLAEMNGLAPADHIGKTVREILPALHKVVTPIFRTVMETGKAARNLEISGETVSAPGVVRHWVEQWLPLKNPSGETTGVQVIVEEVTARKRAEEELRQLNASLEQRVRERTEVLEQRSRQLAELATQVTMIEHREHRRLADNLHDHVQQLLVGAGVEVHALASDQVPRDRKALDRLSRTLTEAIEATRNIARDLAPPISVHGNLPEAFRWLVREIRQRHDLEVHARITGVLTAVPEAESILLFTAARELLLNVVKHAGVRRVELEVSRRPGAVVLKVRDRGCGLHLKRLASQRPTGFGLFSIRERVESLGGTFTLESRPGHGLLVALSVPLPAAPPPPHLERRTLKARARAVPGARSKGQSVDHQRISTLFVDDHRILREALVTSLNGEPDIEVVGECDDGRQAVAAAGRLQPDVVIMDVSMPVMDGVEATRIIKERWPKIRVIGLSMHDEAQGGSRMRAAGADGYVCKAGPQGDLIAAIRRCIRRRPRRRNTRG